jgi:hypothetical protein
MLNYWNTLVQLQLSSCQLESTLPSFIQMLLSHSQQGDLVAQHLSISNVLERISRPSCQPLYGTNTSQCKQETFLYEYPLHWVVLSIKTNSITLFGSTHLKHGRHFDYWYQPQNMGMRVCYLDCYEAVLCCYLVAQAENLLRPLQLFYVCLLPVYWLFFEHQDMK